MAHRINALVFWTASKIGDVSLNRYVNQYLPLHAFNWI